VIEDTRRTPKKIANAKKNKPQKKQQKYKKTKKHSLSGARNSLIKTSASLSTAERCEPFSSLK
jgi:hypothetical protein